MTLVYECVPHDKCNAKNTFCRTPKCTQIYWSMRPHLDRQLSNIYMVHLWYSGIMANHRCMLSLLLSDEKIISLFTHTQLKLFIIITLFITLCYTCIVLLLFNSHQEMHIKSIHSSISCDDNREQLKTPSLTNSNSNESNTEALNWVEICESA